jgi:hypothetical protein
MESLRRETRREPIYVYLMLLASLVLTGFVFAALYLFLYHIVLTRLPVSRTSSVVSSELVVVCV